MDSSYLEACKYDDSFFLDFSSVLYENRPEVVHPRKKMAAWLLHVVNKEENYILVIQDFISTFARLWFCFTFGVSTPRAFFWWRLLDISRSFWSRHGEIFGLCWIYGVLSIFIELLVLCYHLIAWEVYFFLCLADKVLFCLTEFWTSWTVAPFGVAFCRYV